MWPSATCAPARTRPTASPTTRRGRCSTRASRSCAPPACPSPARSAAAWGATPTAPRAPATPPDLAVPLLRPAAEIGPGAIVLGPESHEAALAARVTARIAGQAPTHVIVLNPRAGALGRPLARA